jgi:glutathione S-transferase
MADTHNGIWELWGDPRSGNCWKPASLLQRTGRPWRWHTTDVVSGATREPEFLSLNPVGKVPLLRLPDGRLLSESNAMLLLLAEGTPWLPEDAYQRALVNQWLFWEQYSHEPYIAVARFLLHFEHGLPLDPARMAMLSQRGNQALSVMEQAVSGQPWFAGDTFTVADIALYAYTHVCSDGDFDLEPYPAVQAWLDRVAAQPGHFDLAGLKALI